MLVLVRRDFETALSWPPKIPFLSLSPRRSYGASRSHPFLRRLGVVRELSWMRTTRWAWPRVCLVGVLRSVGAMFLTGSARPRGHAMFWRNHGFTFRDFCKKKKVAWGGAPLSLGAGSKWSSTGPKHKADRGELKGPPKCFRRLRSREILPPCPFLPPPPSG